MENDWTKVLGFPGYRVYQQEIDEEHQQLKLWIRRKRGNRSMTCAGCGRRVHKMHEVYEREIRDLPCFEYQTTVVVELYRVDCPACGGKAEKGPQLPSKSPYSKRFEDAVGQSCGGGAAARGARRGGGVGHRARYGASVYGTWSVAGPAGGSRRCDTWGWTSCTRGSGTSGGRWWAVWKLRSRCGLGRSARRRRWMNPFAPS